MENYAQRKGSLVIKQKNLKIKVPPRQDFYVTVFEEDFNFPGVPFLIELIVVLLYFLEQQYV